MARTVFSIATDKDGSYPEYDTSLENAVNRYEQFSEDKIEFIGEEEYQVPIMKFNIIAEDGGRMPNAPRIVLKAPPQFNLSNINNYTQDGPIFGGGVGGGEGAAAFQKLFDSTREDFLSNAADASAPFLFSAKDAFEYSLKKAGGNLAGFIGSAGLSNISQFEFLTKRTINPMQQQLFKGPSFRRYSLNFNMKPRNLTQAQAIRNAVSCFKIAAAASLPAEKVVNGNVEEGSNFTFGYPHLLQFDLEMKRLNSTDSETLFQSKVCVIETVISDYGGQKMTFLPANYPTETNLAISLIEVTPRTFGDANIDITNGRKIV